MSREVTNRQLVMILVIMLATTAPTFLSKTMAEATEGGFWFAILVTGVIFSLLALLITLLQRKNPGKTLFDHAKDAFGPFWANVIALIYIVFFLLALIFITTDIVSMVSANLLLKTPKWFILFFTLAVSGYGAAKGITNIARLFEIYGFFALTGSVILYVIMLFLGDINYIRPLFVKEDLGRYFGAVWKTAFAFVGLEIITVIPFAKQNKKFPLVSVISTLGIALFYILSVGASIMMIGMEEIRFYKYPVMTAIRQIDIIQIDFLQRFDVVHLFVLLMGANASFMLTSCGGVEYMTKAFPKMKRIIAVLLLTAMAFAGGIFASFFENFHDIAINVLTYYMIFTAFIIPVLLLIFGRRKRNAETA
ncbi:MAG: endospore germination permease [Bacillota bacterium]|jgi:spore germination protein (amino acid permease)|nr:endospore germination permease [Bacillota bacterium]HOA78920.1 endospore germination permease [Bacilli bacterium]HQC90038.1 endospore germination permease [Bacilli bacterium]